MASTSEQEPVCKVCEMSAVPGCRNTLQYPSGGAILMHRGEKLVSVDCPNMRIVALRNRLRAIDPLLLTVPHCAQTPLFQAGEVDRTKADLFIRHVHWRTFLSHFKWVLGSQPAGAFIRVVTDMTLLNVFVGNTNVKNRLFSQRTEDGELLVSNSIEDLLSSPDLAVIRLGHVVHANRAAANMMRETLSLRLGLGKPTWLVEPPEQTFVPDGMVCCDEAVHQLVQASFDEIQLFDPVEVSPAYIEDGDEVTVPAATLSEGVRTAEEDEAVELEDDEDPSDESGTDREADEIVKQTRSRRQSRKPVYYKKRRY